MANVLFPQTAQKTRKRFQTGGEKKRSPKPQLSDNN